MPVLHLPLTPYDLLSTIFRTIFQASQVTTGYGVCVYTVYEQRANSCTGFRRRTGAKPYGDRGEIVRKSCSHRAVSARKSCRAHAASAASVRRPRGDGTVTVRSPFSFGHSCTKSVQLSLPASLSGLLLFKDGQGCNNRLLPSPFLPQLQSHVRNSEPE